MIQSSTRARPRRRGAALGLLPLGLVGGFLGGRSLRARKPMPLRPALDGAIEYFDLPFGRVAYYNGGLAEGTPLLLVHSVNAAASSYEVKPLFDHYARHRPVLALELPGFGYSDRQDVIYTPRLMSDAIVAMIEVIRARHGLFPVDAMALSLSAEFLARAADQHPTYFRSLGFVSPTGFEKRLERESQTEGHFGKPGLRDAISFPIWRRALFDALVSRTSMRFFLEKTWGAKRIDEGLLDYGYVSAHQPGAEYAPLSFIAGFLFSRDALTLYKSLSLPVWMCHGVRGDFVDYGRKGDVEGRPNWTVDVFPTGALPQFEKLAAVTASYDAFLLNL